MTKASHVSRVPPGSMAVGQRELGVDSEGGGGIGVIVDVKTAGFYSANDVVVELAARRFAYDAHYVVTRFEPAYVWREDPGEPLPEEFVQKEGLTNMALVGLTIDRGEATQVIGSADICIAHSARFDRPIVETLLPEARGLAWACSVEDINWNDRGVPASTLQAIASWMGVRHDPERSPGDIDVVLQLLRHELENDRTTFSIMMESARQESWLVRLSDAPVGARNALSARGYQWDFVRGSWWKEVRDRKTEEMWLSGTLYVDARDCWRAGAQFKQLDWRNRYA